MSKDREALASKLIADIKSRKKIFKPLDSIDFVVFSGDLAFSGKKSEFEAARRDLLNPVLEVLGGNPKVFMVPGNHDFDRDSLPKIPPDWARKLTESKHQVSGLEDHVFDKEKMPFFQKPQEEFFKFARKFGNAYASDRLHCVHAWKVHGVRVALIGLNTAWQCARYTVKASGNTKANKQGDDVWDYGLLRVMETQMRQAIADAGAYDIGILVMHHPIYWLSEIEQAKIEPILLENVHLVLHGHEHRPRMNRVSSSFGDVVVVPAGASWNRRIAQDPRYTNSYNFCSINVDSLDGALFHRVWSEEADRWIADTRFWAAGVSNFVLSKRNPEKGRMARGHILRVQEKYQELAYKRPAKLAEVTVRHDPVIIAGEKFLEATVRWKFVLHRGEQEIFPLRTLTNKRIAGHKNIEVRRQAFTFLSSNPQIVKLKGKSKAAAIESNILGEIAIDEDETEIEYQYKMLETTEGVWYFNVRRFCDRVKVTIMKSRDHDYEEIPIGGLPEMKPAKDSVLPAEFIDQTGGCIPNQGYLVQWYPKGHLHD